MTRSLSLPQSLGMGGTGCHTLSRMNKDMSHRMPTELGMDLEETNTHPSRRMMQINRANGDVYL